MFRLFVASFFFASASCCVPIIFPPVPPGTISSDVCKGALLPAVSVSLKSLAKCVAEQPGVGPTVLATIIGGGDPAASLQANGQKTAAKALRLCMAKELGLVNAKGTLNMTKLKGILIGKVSGAVFAENTQIGLDNCPAVVDFNVQDYLLCVLSSCSTGDPPIIPNTTGTTDLL